MIINPMYFYKLRVFDLLTGTAFVLAIIGAIVSIIIPDKETLIEMQIAKYATFENAEWTLDKLKEAVDYIVSKIGELK